MEWIATAAFGLEGVVAGELRALGFENVKAASGGATFTALPQGAFFANLFLRSAERVRFLCAKFTAKSFEELFENTAALPWEDWLTPDANFPVNGKCVRSQLMSLPDCQRIVKKAIVTRLGRKHKIEWFPETGARYSVDVSISQDMATITLDTSGPSLSKRGYRPQSGEAPLRETLAAALLQTISWDATIPLCDPMCGSGTFVIEAAFQALHRAPGLMRTFDCEAWHCMPKDIIKEMRKEAHEHFAQSKAENAGLKLYASDIDPAVVGICAKSAENAGVLPFIHIEEKPALQVSHEQAQGIFVVNPPYGERLLDKQQAETCYRDLRSLKKAHTKWPMHIITSHPQFEKIFGLKADVRRRVYNGRLECEWLSYMGPKKR